MSILCIPTTSGGGGGTHTNILVIGDCRWDDGSADDADVPASNPGFTGGCQNGTPVQTELTNTILNDCQWDNGSENSNDKPASFVSDGLLHVYTCVNGVLGIVDVPAP